MHTKTVVFAVEAPKRMIGKDGIVLVGLALKARERFAKLAKELLLPVQVSDGNILIPAKAEGGKFKFQLIYSTANPVTRSQKEQAVRTIKTILRGEGAKVSIVAYPNGKEGRGFHNTHGRRNH